MSPLRALSLILPAVGAACHAADRAPAPVEAPIGPFAIAPGEEKTQCIVYPLDNPAPAFIRRIHADLSPHTHHVTLYRSAATAEQRTPFECRGFDTVLEGDEPLFIAQQTRADLAFPDDDHGAPVGFAIDARQMVRVEIHSLDTTAAPATASGRFTIDTVPPSAALVPADIAFWGTVGIDIPPLSSWETPVKFVEAPPTNRMFALTTHQHRLGTRMRVWYADDADDVASVPLADSRSWSDPPVELFNPALAFGSGGAGLKKGLAYQCAWNNTTADPVTFGEGFHDEMCFLWQYYYPGRGFDHLVQP